MHPRGFSARHEPPTDVTLMRRPAVRALTAPCPPQSPLSKPERHLHALRPLVHRRVERLRMIRQRERVRDERHHHGAPARDQVHVRPGGL